MPNEYTVGEWAEKWYAQGLGRWNANTAGGYRNLIFRHIIPSIGRKKLDKLKPIHIQAFYDELTKSGLSSRSVWCVHLLLRRILDEACKDGLIEVNPADFCEVSVKEAAPSKYIRTKRIRDYLDAAETVDVLPIIYIGLTVGLRQCELFTVLWADFDIPHRCILRGRRLLMLNDRAVALLNEEHDRHPNSPYAFLSPNTGEPFKLQEFYYLHRKLSAQVRLPKLGFRDLQKQCEEIEL